MRYARLLLAAPAATALVFTGISPAWAGDDGDGHHHDDDASAEVLRIGGEAELRDDGNKLAVRFKYECEDDGEDLEADVKADNDARYEKKGVDLDCDGDSHWITVELKQKSDNEAEDGDKVDVTVKIDVPGGDDAEKTRKDVDVVDDFSDHHDHDHDKDHH
jgi:hypothetical protein